MSDTGNSNTQAGKGMRVGLWVVQAMLAFVFGAAGIVKLTQPIAEIAAKMPWAATMPELLVRFIGLSELSGALGLILPSVTRIKPMLTPWAARGLITVMVLAAALHITRGEYAAVGANLLLASLALFVAWGRSRKAPIAPRP